MANFELEHAEIEHLTRSERILSERLYEEKEDDFEKTARSYTAPANLFGRVQLTKITRRIRPADDFIHVDMDIEVGSSLGRMRPYITTTATFIKTEGGFNVGYFFDSQAKVKGKPATLEDFEKGAEILKSMEENFSQSPPRTVGYSNSEGAFSPQRIRTFFC